MSYTKGKWFVEESYSIDAIAMLGKFNVQREVGVRRAGSYDDARRIVDCVNACDGMESPDDEIAELRRERGELLKELDVLSNGYHGNGWDVGLASRLDSARNLVKKLKEK